MVIKPIPSQSIFVHHQAMLIVSITVVIVPMIYAIFFLFSMVFMVSSVFARRIILTISRPIKIETIEVTRNVGIYIIKIAKPIIYPSE